VKELLDDWDANRAAEPFASSDSLYGGHSNYDAHLAHSTLQYRF